MSSSTKLDISKLNVKFEFIPWDRHPGVWIHNQSETPQKAKMIFDAFVEKKMPEALRLLTKLNDTQHLSPAHLSLTITSIFLIYISDQIELYQNQRETRDPEVDQKFEQFKEAFAKERYQLCTHNPKWADAFFVGLKRSLIEADVLTADFDQTIDLWLKLISIAHVGDLDLVSCFDKKAETTKHIHNKKVYTNLQRGNLESSFYLLARQLSLNLKWFVQKVGDKLNFPEDVELAAIFFAATDPANLKNRLMGSKTEILADSIIQNDFKIFIRELLSLDLTNNATIQAYLDRLKNIMTHLNCYGDLSFCVAEMQKVNMDNYKLVICGTTSFKKEITKEVFPKLRSLTENRQECHMLIDCYLKPSCIVLGKIFDSLIASNLDIEKFNKEGVMPASNTESLLPPPKQYNAKAFEELCSAPLPKHTPKKKRGKNNAPQSTPTPEEPKVVSKAAPSAPPPSIEKPLIIPPVSPLEQLKRQLFTIHAINPAVSVRQALWHLDILMTLKTTTVTAENNLAVLNLAGSSAQKLLEQIYRYCLETRGIQAPTSHNLKDYHKALENSPYPDIVQELYLANHWTRYFYTEKDKWSFSAQVVHIPSLLVDLVAIAEGAPAKKNPSIAQGVQQIIEKTHAHAKKILPQGDASLAKGFLAEDIPIQFNPTFNLKCFNKTKNSLSLFLSKASLPRHHPVSLRLKQGIAAMTILTSSLREIQKAKTPRELVTWTSLCVQQTQETLENVLHAVEFFEKGEMSSVHDLQKLSTSLNLQMGPLADACQQLSYKARYPAENLSDGLGAQIIDDVETLRQYPECLEGFNVVGKTPMLWKPLSKDLSLKEIMARLVKLVEMTEGFLQAQALPALLKHQR